MTDKLTTAQKAEAWLAFLNEITPTKHEQLGAEIITALLKEDRALLDAIGLFKKAGFGNSTCFETQCEAFRCADKAIAMCEEQNNE